MFRLPSAWNIPQSSDECEFSSCENDQDDILQSSEFDSHSNVKDKRNYTPHALNVTPSTVILRKRPSSSLDKTLDDSDIETSPAPPIIRQNSISKSSFSKAVPNKFGPPTKPAHASASSIEEIEVDPPTQGDLLLLPKTKTQNDSSSACASGWIKSIQDPVIQQRRRNTHSSRARPNSRTESVLVRQAHAAVQRNRDTFISSNHLLHSQTLAAMHSCDFMLLSVVTCEPCHLPVFPVRVHFCSRKSSNLAPSQCVITCFLPLVSMKHTGDVKPGDFLIIGQPWRAVECIDARTNRVSINIFCSDFVLKCPFIPRRESTFLSSSCAHIESLPFMCYSAFASRLLKSSVISVKQNSIEQRHDNLSSIGGADNMCVVKLHEIWHQATVEATASVADFELAICTKDLIFAVPVAIVSFEGDSHVTVCYCSPGDFETLSQQLREKCSYSIKHVVKESYSDSHCSHFRAFIQIPSVQYSFEANNRSAVYSSHLETISSRFSLQLEYHHQFSFKSRVDHVMVPENGHGFARFSFLDYPVYGCIIGISREGLLIPIFVTSSQVADLIFGSLSRRPVDFATAAPQKPWMFFQGLSLVPAKLGSFSDDPPSVIIADGFAELVLSVEGNSSLNRICPSNFGNLLQCRSQSVVIVDSFYNGGDQMCPKCHSSCSLFHSDSICRHCGFCGPSNHFASGYLPLYLLVSDSISSESPSTHVLQIRGGALSSFIKQYMGCCMLWSGCEAAENLKDSLAFSNSLKGQHMRCCTLAHAVIDESVSMCERRPAWMHEACSIGDVKEVLQVSIE